MADGQYIHLLGAPDPVGAFIAKHIGLPQLHLMAKVMLSMDDVDMRQEGFSEAEIKATDDLFCALDDLLMEQVKTLWPNVEALV